MTVFVAEIADRPIVAFGAEGLDEAEAVTEAEEFRAGLGTFETDGKPLWDGEAEIHVREATGEERDKWHTARARAVLADIEDADEVMCLLVPVIGAEDWPRFQREHEIVATDIEPTQ
jgi:hypothetical protein